VRDRVILSVLTGDAFRKPPQAKTTHFHLVSQLSILATNLNALLLHATKNFALALTVIGKHFHFSHKNHVTTSSHLD